MALHPSLPPGGPVQERIGYSGAHPVIPGLAVPDSGGFKIEVEGSQGNNYPARCVLVQLIEGNNYPARCVLV